MIRLTRAQVREVDRRSIEDYHIPGIVLMENAARAVASAACEMLGNDCIGQILMLVGGGNNGGDALAAARHLHNRGADVTLALTTDPSRFGGDALVNWKIVSAMGLRAVEVDPDRIAHSPARLIVDGIFGTGLSQPPREPFAGVVRAVARSRIPVLAIDLPSGMDCDTGHVLGAACIQAAQTVSFVASKAGFAHPQAAQYTGAVTVADIGCPRTLIEDVLRDLPA
jgi:NAD(P)H-hydrate epimerase